MGLYTRKNVEATDELSPCQPSLPRPPTLLSTIRLELSEPSLIT